jgi:tetratricopeptide (TPR) repeat protein
MVIKDYKSKDAYRSLGLRRGKAAIKREISSLTPRRIYMWLGLFALIALVNYFVFVRFGPPHNTGLRVKPVQESHTISDTFAEWFDKGCKRYQEGDLEGAAKAYTKAITLNPEEIRSYFNRGIVYIQLDMHDEAIDDFNKVIALDPDYAEAYNNRAWAYLRKDMFDPAIQDCNKALVLDPTMATAYHTRGAAYRGKGLPEMAKLDFQKGCELGDINGCQDYERLLKTRDNET